MKCLKIENDKGFYLNEKNEWSELDKINKEGLLYLLNIILDSKEPVEMDQYDDNKIKNPGHRIIYKNIYNKFSNALSQRNQFADEKESLYKDAINKYSQELDEESSSNA